MLGALSSIDGSRETGREFTLGWYERAGEAGLGEGGIDLSGETSLPPSLLLKRTFVVLIRGALLFDIELSTSWSRLLMSLSTAGAGGSSSATFVPDSLALARANTSYGDPPGELRSDEKEGLLLLLLSSSVFSSRIVEPLYG